MCGPTSVRIAAFPFACPHVGCFRQQVLFSCLEVFVQTPPRAVSCKALPANSITLCRQPSCLHVDILLSQVGAVGGSPTLEDGEMIMTL